MEILAIRCILADMGSTRAEPASEVGKEGIKMTKLVRLWKRPSKDGLSYKYSLIYIDGNGKRRRKSLGHADKRKAERQAAQLERDLRMDTVEPESMTLSTFLEDCLERTRGQVRESTLAEYNTAMNEFISTTGNIDIANVQHVHGERFIQSRLDNGNRPATARKKLKALKRLFQMAVERGQLEKNPLTYVRQVKVPEKLIRVYSDDECNKMLKAAREYQAGKSIRWDLMILTALSTGMRRGEILNTTWRDIDFGSSQILVRPKEETEYTWEWHIKDTEIRKIPLQEGLIKGLAAFQAEQPSGYPYVFVPPVRYGHIQEVRLQGQWSVSMGRCPLNNFTDRFNMITRRAGIDGRFHDLRCTCITNWFANGLNELEVMKMAGHSSFETTRKFYLAIQTDLLDKAKAATEKAMKNISVTHLLHPEFQK